MQAHLNNYDNYINYLMSNSVNVNNGISKTTQHNEKTSANLNNSDNTLDTLLLKITENFENTSEDT
jgi:hypothetical protein